MSFMATVLVHTSIDICGQHLKLPLGVRYYCYGVHSLNEHISINYLDRDNLWGILLRYMGILDIEVSYGVRDEPLCTILI